MHMNCLPINPSTLVCKLSTLQKLLLCVRSNSNVILFNLFWKRSSLYFTTLSPTFILPINIIVVIIDFNRNNCLLYELERLRFMNISLLKLNLEIFIC